MSSTRNITLLEIVFISAFFTVIAFIMYYPVSLNMGTMLTDKYDGMLETWIITWGVKGIRRLFFGIWDAPIFFPHKGTFAFSETMLGVALLSAPFLYATSNPVFAHNAFILCSFMLSGIGTYLLVKKLTSNNFAALIGGFVFAFCPWKLGRIGATNLIANHWIPFILLCFFVMLENPKKRYSFILAILFVLNWLTSFYNGAICALALFVVFVVKLVECKFLLAKKVWIALIIFTFSAGVIIFPITAQYYTAGKKQGIERTVEQAINLSADPLDYLRAAKTNRLWGNITEKLENKYSKFKSEHRFFPGVTVCALVLLSLSFPSRRDKYSGRKTFIWIGIVGFIFSLGPYLHVGGNLYRIPLLYLLVAKLIPCLGAFRVPARFGALVELSFAVLCSYGFLRVSELLANRKKNILCLTTFFVLLFLEFFSAPMPSHIIPTGENIPPVYRWLKEQKGIFAVIELPQLDAPPSGIPFPQNQKADPLGFRYPYFLLYHGKKIINGRASFIPKTTSHILQKLNDGPDEKTQSILGYLGVKYVFLHTKEYYWLSDKEKINLIHKWWQYFPSPAQFGDDWVFAIPSCKALSQEGNWQDLTISEIFIPQKVGTGEDFLVEIGFILKNTNPFYSFETIAIDAFLTCKIGNSLYEKETQKRDFFLIDPLEKQWWLFNFEAPDLNGDYDCLLLLKGVDGKIRREHHFRLKVGEFHDSLMPNILSFMFVSLHVPDYVHAGETFEIEAEVKNTGDTLWLAHPKSGEKNNRGVVSLGIRKWFDSQGIPMEGEREPFHTRGYLERSLNPGESTTVKIIARAPTNPGHYTIKIDMVDEHILWFEDIGGKAVEVKIRIIDK